MVVRNVSLSDDSSFGTLGRYECHAFAVGDPVERRHGFSVTVIARKLYMGISSESVGPNVPFFALGQSPDKMLCCTARFK